MDPTDRRHAAADYINSLLDSRALPRNQVAALSGLSNAYIQHLENGQIANVDRKKLIAFAVALSLDLFDVDRMLTLFDRAKLDTGDIPLFINLPGNRKLSTALLPLQTWFSYELFLLSEEKKPGKLIVINDRPTASIIPTGYRMHCTKNFSNPHPILFSLIEAVGSARRENFFNLINDYPVDHYICHECLLAYFKHDPEEDEKNWRHKHLIALIDLVENHANFNLYITNYCSKFNFTIKAPDTGEKNNEKLFFLGNAPHSNLFDERVQLLGFATENKTIVKNFRKTLKVIEACVIEELKDRRKMSHFLHNL